MSQRALLHHLSSTVRHSATATIAAETHPRLIPTDALCDALIGMVKLALTPLHFQPPRPIAILRVNATVCTHHNTFLYSRLLAHA